MDETLLRNLAPPRLETLNRMLMAGLTERYNLENCSHIPAQWQRFSSYLGHVPGQIGRFTYGVLCNGDEIGNVEYICAVEVSDFARTPPELGRLRIPEQRYAVFTQHDHISTIQRTWLTIWKKGLPEAGLHASGGPEFERYGEAFDPDTGNGGFEIWIPTKM